MSEEVEVNLEDDFKTSSIEMKVKLMVLIKDLFSMVFFIKDMFTVSYML